MSNDIKVQLLQAFEWSNDTMLEKAHDRIEELEGKLAKAVEMLDRLSFARTTLAEMKGETND